MAETDDRKTPAAREKSGAIRDFRDLICWQKGMVLAREVYKLTGSFPAEERYGLTSQVRRAAVGIAANIAEGFGRSSRADYLRFLDMARGSANELETLLQLSVDLGVSETGAGSSLMNDTREVQRIVAGLIRALHAIAKKGVRT